MTATIRAAVLGDARHLPAVERAAARTFASLPDLAWIAGTAPMAAWRHRQLIAHQASWVAEQDGRPIGFLIAQPAGTELHIVELSVMPLCQNRGLGRRLIATAAGEARRRGMDALTLTTFREVPWNAPFYARLGFEEVPARALTPRLAAIRAGEARHGLPSQQRCAMRRTLPVERAAA